MLISVFDNVSPDPVVLGGKASGLVRMLKEGINVPPFMVIPTTVCVNYMKDPIATMEAVSASLESKGALFSDVFGYQPLVSVRSGARASMPGMLDTILNVGIDTHNLTAWEQRLGVDCARDSFKRLIAMYGNVVDGFPRQDLERETLPEMLEVYARLKGSHFPSAHLQLVEAILAVFKSWNNPRAKAYRKLNSIPEDWGTAVTIQSMVFGNMNANSCTGVLFTRDPDTGVDTVVGEFLVNAQGEDVVAGITTPLDLSKLVDWNQEVSKELLQTVTKLEVLNADVQDVEFTVQDGTLYILQTRSAKRSARAAVKIALDMYDKKLLTLPQSIARVSERELDLATQDVIDPTFKTKPYAIGIPACNGVVTGVVCLSSASAKKVKNKKVILVTEETTPDDIEGMHAAVGILTMTGGSTSHASVVARSMNRACVVGLGKKHLPTFKEGDTISIDGSTGKVWCCAVPVTSGDSSLVQRFRSLKVGDSKLLVTSPPDMRVEELCLELGSILHADMEDIKEVLHKCLAKTGRLGLSYIPGASKVFMSEVAISAKLALVASELQKLTQEPVQTYGFDWDHASILFHHFKHIEELILLKKSALIRTPLGNLTPAHKKVIKWLEGEGIHISVWNTKNAGPAVYSVVTS